MKCWEHLKCKPENRDNCKAYPHNGNKCWQVTGTKCKGITQGSPMKKLAECQKCDYFIKYIKD